MAEPGISTAPMCGTMGARRVDDILRVDPIALRGALS